MALLIFYLLLAIGVSFLCSVSEAVLLSTRPSYIAAMDPKRKTTKTLKRLTNNLDRPLAAILTANTIAHTVGAAGVGAQANIVFGNQYLGIVSAILTFMILVFSEIIPKTLGAVYWKELAPLFGRIIQYMTIILFPFVWCSQKLTNLISRSQTSAFTYTRDEVEAMIDIGKEEGVLDKKEHKIVTNMMKLHKLSVRDIMTPRTVIFSLQENLTVQDFFTSHAKIAFSRIPIFADNEDDITGYVLKTDLLIAQAKDNFNHQLHQYKRDTLLLSDNINASSAYNHLMYAKAHISLIIDEYGSVQGIVTLEDIVETLIGLEIMDEMDTVEDMQLLARKRWRERMTEMGIQLS